MQTYIVATIKPWNLDVYKRIISRYPGRWFVISDPKRLTSAFIEKTCPTYIFFPHWSWKVPKPILDAVPCVCFHETDLPYGRGGSPIQNLIVRGHKKTMISAIRMEEGIDTGPIYLKKAVTLSGSAEQIFKRNATVVAGMIRAMIKKSIQPKAQRGRVVVFKRRIPLDSDIARLSKPTLEKVYDLIRMLDADTYPHACLKTKGIHLEFRRAQKKGDTITAEVTITKSPL